MEFEWKWDRLDPLECRIAEFLLHGESNAAICAEVFLSRARVQECIKRILIKTGASTSRAAIVLLVEERENQSLLRVLEQATDGVAIVQDRVVKFANRAMLEMLGYDLEAMAETPFVELVAPKSRDQAAKQYELRLRGEPFSQSYVVGFLCKGGREKDVLVSSGGQIQFRGRPAVLGIMVPHTVHRENHRSPWQLGAPIRAQDLDHGDSEAKGVGNGQVYEGTIMVTDWKWNTFDPIERKIAEILVQGKSNSAISSEVFLSRPRVQECIKRILIKTGARSTRGAIALLLEERENVSLLRVLDQASDGVVILQDRLVKFVNRALERSLGYDLEEIAGTPFVELIAPRSKGAQANNYDLRMRGQPSSGTYVATALCKGGQEKDMMVTSAGLIQYRGRPALLAFTVPRLSGE